MMNKLHWVLPLLLTALAGCSDNDSNNSYSTPPLNQAPQATAAAVTTEADTEVNGMLMGMDADGDALLFILAVGPMQGTLMLAADGDFTYWPAANFTGADQFTFTVSDGKKTSAPATVTIAINPQELMFGDYSRAAFEQTATDEPLPLNGREFEQDVVDAEAYDDLLM